MDPKKKQQIAAGLAVFAVLLLVRGFTVKPFRSTLPAGAQTKTVSDTKRQVSDTPSAPISRFAEWGGNPFEVERRAAPSPEAAATPGVPRRFVLSGILWDAKNPSAILDGQVVGVGQEIHGWKVVEIDKNKVILSNGMSEETVSLQ